MLQRIRGSLNSFLVLVLMGLLIAVFALWGVGDIFRAPGAQSVASVNGEDIALNVFDRRFRQLVSEQQQVNPDFTSQQAFAAGYDQAVLARIIRDEIISQQGRKFGLTASNKQVSKLISEEPSFQIAGQFDVTRYRQFLKSNGLDESKLFDDLRADQARIDLMTGLMNAVFVPDVMAESQMRFLKEKRTGTIVTLPVSGFTVTETPGDDVLQPFFEERSNLYSVPEYRSFNYVAITADKVSETIELSDDELLAEYELRQDQYITPELRRLDQVVFPTREDADAFYDRVAAGEDFVALADELAGFSDTDMALGDFSKAAVLEQFNETTAEVVFALPEQGITEAQETSFGWAVFRVRRIEAGVSRTFEDVKDELRIIVAQDRALGRLYDLSQLLDDAFATGANLAEAAESLDLEVQTVDNVSQVGQLSDGSNPRNGARVTQMLDTVFQLDLGNVLETVPLGEDGYFAVELLTIDPERPMTFEEAKANVTTEWQIAETDRRAKDAAQALADKADSSISLAGLAAADQLDVIQDISFERLQLNQGGDRTATAARLLFSLEEGKAAVAPSIGGTSYIIAFLSEIEDGEADKNAPEYFAIKQQVTQLMQNDVQGQFLSALQEENDIRINERSLQAYRDQISAPIGNF